MNDETEVVELNGTDGVLETLVEELCNSVVNSPEGSKERGQEVENLETIIKLQNDRAKISLDNDKFELEKARAVQEKKDKNKNFWKDIGLTVGQIGAYCGMGLLTIKAASEYGRMPGDGEKFFRQILNLIKRK